MEVHAEAQGLLLHLHLLQNVSLFVWLSVISGHYIT